VKLDRYLSTRIPVATHQAFLKRAIRNGGVSKLLRVLIEALVENRLTIQPKKEEILK
jgi:hypothetical protein